jgi:hypothetical protein
MRTQIIVIAASQTRQGAMMPYAVNIGSKHFAGNQRFQTFESLLRRQNQKFGVLDVFKSEAARAPRHVVIAAQLILRAPLRQASPEKFKLMLATRAAARAILCDTNLGRVLDDAARIEMRELPRDSPDKVPCAASACEKVGQAFPERVGRFVRRIIVSLGLKI